MAGRAERGESPLSLREKEKAPERGNIAGTSVRMIEKHYGHSASKPCPRCTRKLALRIDAHIQTHTAA